MLVTNETSLDLIHTLVNKEKPEYAIMCLVTTFRGEPKGTICYREVF